MKNVCIAVLILFSVAAATAAPALALERFDFEQRYFIEYGPEVKDHALIRVDGVYHLFYLRGNPAVDIGRATSPDLIHWEILPPVLAPGDWDAYLWAPQVLQDASGTWIMYYTGVNEVFAQQAGIAASHDLENWTKLPWPVYNPDPMTWASWDENAWSHGRDPFVLEHNGLFYMLNTALTWGGSGAISCATSTDMYNWTDDGPIFVNDSWHVLESVQCIPRGGKYHMFFTEEAVFGTSHMVSDDFLTGWDGANKTWVDNGHAPEVNEFDPGVFTFSRHSVYNYGNGIVQYVLKFDYLNWFGDIPMVHEPWALEDDWTRVSGTAFSFSPTFFDNSARRGEDVDVGFEGACYVSSYERYTGPMGIGTPGGAGGDTPVGVMHSRTFTVQGNSINLLVGGSNEPANAYVALIDASNDEILIQETGRDTDEMDRRVWDVEDYRGMDVYIAIVDNSTSGHIAVDDITESHVSVSSQGGGTGRGNNKKPPVNNVDRIVQSTELSQNSPNPFNPTTTITYTLSEQSEISLLVYDVEGRLVRELETSVARAPGFHQVVWDGRNNAGMHVSSGTYFYRLIVNGANFDTKKMLLLK